MRPLRLLGIAALAFVLLVAASRRRSVAQPHPLDARRSFVVTDRAILDGFSFERVLTALSDGTSTTPLGLYQQWFDTQNPKPGLAVADAPHCDDFATDGMPSFNGFPRRCPTPEGSLATTDPFVMSEYFPIGITNRFDLTPADGANCGQYRLIFARKSQNSLHIIFESVLPNPNPAAGIAGCRAVAQFWADLSSVDSLTERRARLEMFFFQGLPGFSPVVSAANYAGAGGIRTAQRVPQTFRMYQFRTATRCDGSGICRVQMLPDVLENEAFGRLFDAHDDSPKARAFREDFIRQVPALAIRDVNLYFMNIPHDYLMAESDPDPAAQMFVYDVPFANGLATADGKAFRDRIAAELARIGSTLTPAQIVVRAETQTCVGCHFLSGDQGEGVTFPRSDNLAHITESLEPGEGGPQSRFAVSPAVSEVFVPHRMAILREFLATGTAPVHSN